MQGIKEDDLYSRLIISVRDKQMSAWKCRGLKGKERRRCLEKELAKQAVKNTVKDAIKHSLNPAYYH